ncbi:MAG: pyrimidine dimer DNA glycosylase/endonuclease V [Candidatus Woesearchaeota archaeon]
MVRINLLNPKCLTDQHLIAEYDEILMLLGYVERYPKIRFIKGKSEIPEKYTLNKGHMKFFKDKLKYIKKRHESIKEEMRMRGFKPIKTIDLNIYPKNLHNDWKPDNKDYKVIIERITWKINKKPEYYRYYGKYRDKDFLIKLLSKHDTI